MEDLRDVLEVLADESKWRKVEHPERVQPKRENVTEDLYGYATGEPKQKELAREFRRINR